MPIVSIAMALAQFAPSLMRIFGAGEPSVSVAEKVVGIAQHVTGASSPEEALQKMQIDAQAQRDFDLAVKAQEVELEKAYLADRQNARARDVELVRVMGRPNRRADVLAYAAVGMLATVLILLFVVEPRTGSRDLLMIALGALLVIVKDVYGFEFGTSKDSQRNAQVVADIAKET